MTHQKTLQDSTSAPLIDTAFSTLAARIAGDGSDAWELHRAGMLRKRAGEDVLILSIGEDVGNVTPAPIVSAAVDALHDGLHHYAPLAGTLDLREHIAQRHTATTGQATTPDNVVVFAGAQNALFAVSLCLAEQGDEVVIIEPFYSTYPATFSAGGAALTRIAAPASAGFVPDIDTIAAALTPATRLVVLNTPNNPTGAVYPADFVRQVSALCEQHGIWLLSDEVYANFVFAGQHNSPAALFSREQQCVVVSSLSKSHLMSGWRMGWVVAPTPLCSRLVDLVLCMNYGLPLFIQAAACTAIEQPEQLVDEHVARYAKRAQLVVNAFQDMPGIQFTPPASGMFVMFDVSATGLSAKEFAYRVLSEHGVCLLPCNGFGAGLEHHIRMSLCASEDDLARACKAIGHVIQAC